MTERNDGGQAFPRAPFTFEHRDLKWDALEQGGMTLRQYYKAAALTGLIAENAHESSSGSWWIIKEITEKAGQFADAMIAEDESHG